MRGFKSLALGLLLTGMCGCKHEVLAGFPDDSKNLRELQGQGAGKGSKTSKDPEEEVVLIVRYKTEHGKNNAQGLAKNGKFEMDLDNSPTVAIRTTRKEMQKLRNDPDIEAVDENEAMYALPLIRSKQESRRLAESVPYGISMVQADPNGAGYLAQGPNPIKVCVVDTGYGVGHPDLPTPLEHGVTGTNTGSGPWNEDGHGHGSHCAGTIGAIGNNNVGVTSINPNPNKFTFHIGKGLSNSGSGTTTSVMDAVAGCVNAGAKVVSMSLGGGPFSSTSELLYKDYYDRGVLFIAAAGNGGNSGYSYPASYKYVMSIAAVDSSENKASFSQFNDQVEIAGPGVGVLSTITLNSGTTFDYASWSGTSMATPHVAGVAALVWSHFPLCSNHQIRNVLLRTAKDKGPAGCDTSYGFGIVQAKAAYDLLFAQGCEAGGTTPNPPSSASFGGCAQTPCTSNSMCNDGNVCTDDTCNLQTGVCNNTPNNNCADAVEVSILTDNYPSETSWKLKAGTTDIASGGGYTAAATTYTKTINVASGCYEFTIYDSYGDGVCCAYGSGSYTVKLNGVVKKTGGQFASSETTANICTTVAPTTPAPTAPPTPAPTPAPTAPPTPAPTPSPTPAPTPAPTPFPTVCQKAGVEQSCLSDNDCCSGICSSGKPSQRKCLATA